MLDGVMALVLNYITKCTNWISITNLLDFCQICMFLFITISLQSPLCSAFHFAALAQVLLCLAQLPLSSRVVVTPPRARYSPRTIRCFLDTMGMATFVAGGNLRPFQFSPFYTYRCINNNYDICILHYQSSPFLHTTPI